MGGIKDIGIFWVEDEEISKYSEYLCMTNQAKSDINGYFSLFTTHTYMNYTVETTPIPTNMATIAGQVPGKLQDKYE